MSSLLFLLLLLMSSKTTCLDRCMQKQGMWRQDNLDRGAMRAHWRDRMRIFSGLLCKFCCVAPLMQVIQSATLLLRCAEHSQRVTRERVRESHSLCFSSSCCTSACLCLHGDRCVTCARGDSHRSNAELQALHDSVASDIARSGSTKRWY